MTRRKFLHRLMKAGSVLIAGTCWAAKKASPRRFVRAIRLKKYPGSVGPLTDISKPAKWSG
ncbi:MAG: hypothetical protein ACYSUC_09880 [Planctomycetota bacterium]